MKIMYLSFAGFPKSIVSTFTKDVAKAIGPLYRDMHSLEKNLTRVKAGGNMTWAMPLLTGQLGEAKNLLQFKYLPLYAENNPGIYLDFQGVGVIFTQRVLTCIADALAKCEKDSAKIKCEKTRTTVKRGARALYYNCKYSPIMWE